MLAPRCHSSEQARGADPPWTKSFCQHLPLLWLLVSFVEALALAPDFPFALPFLWPVISLSFQVLCSFCLFGFLLCSLPLHRGCLDQRKLLFWRNHLFCMLGVFVGRLFVVRPFGWKGWRCVVSCIFGGLRVVARWGLLRRIFRTIC